MILFIITKSLRGHVKLRNRPRQFCAYTNKFPFVILSFFFDKNIELEYKR